MTRPGGLGRGLGALIPTADAGSNGLLRLPITSVVPNERQPRGGFDQAALQALAQSIREVGVLQPILVRPRAAGGYEIVAGERRLRAAGLAGLSEVPAVVRHTADDGMLTEALVENIHRIDLNPLEEAAAYQQLLDDFGWTHEMLAAKIGRSRSAITNAVRLLGLPPAVQRDVATGLLSAGHARALLALDDPERQQRAAERVVAEALSVRATEELVRRLAAEAESEQALDDLARTSRQRRRSPYEGLQRRLGDALATKVEIKGTPRRGRVIINYAGQEDLERLLALLSRGTGAELLEE